MQKFTIEGRLSGYNELDKATRRHWAVGQKLKNEHMQTVQIYAMAGHIKPVKTYPCEVYITCYEPNARRDDGNVKAGASKIILDALQNMGILTGDGRKYVRSCDMPVEVDRQNPRVEVEIREVDNEN